MTFNEKNLTALVVLMLIGLLYLGSIVIRLSNDLTDADHELDAVYSAYNAEVAK